MWLLTHKVLLPGCSTLERYVARLRGRVEARLWHSLGRGISSDQQKKLESLLVVPAGSRSSHLDRLRMGPVTISSRSALIIVSANPLRCHRHQIGLLGRSGSSARRPWGQRHALEHLREQGFVGTAKEALGGGRAVGATDMIVVYGGERRELAVAQAMAAMVMQGQLTVTALHPGAAALEAIGAIAGV